MDELAPGHGYAELGAEWAAGRGWEAAAELGAHVSWGEVYAKGWYDGDAGGVGVGVRW